MAEIFRLGTSKTKENLAFRRYLRARHRPADRLFQILAAEVEQQIDCTQCANCCRHSIVPVSTAEIETIAGYVSAPPDTVTRLYTDPDPDDRSARILRSSAEGCVFLHRNLCTIYDARPKTCRDFPHIAHGVRSLGSRLSSHARWAALCPIVYNTLERLKHSTGFHIH